MTAQQLKNSILQMAVQGKLVPQNPNDEPASVLLERVQAEKQELIKQGKIKKPKKTSTIFRGATHNLPYAFCEQTGKDIKDISDEVPFDIPERWEWCRLGICLDVRDGTHDTPKYISQGVPLITSKNLCNGKIDFTTAKFISEEDYYAISQRSKVDNGDIMFAMIGSIGNPVLYCGNEDFSIKNMALFKPIKVNHGIDMKYVYWFLYLSQIDMKKYASGGVQSFVSLSYLRDYFIPLPPLAEQHRIVAKIEELIPYIEQYNKAETQLTTLNTTFPETLKKSILQEAVQGKLVPQNPTDEPASVLLERIKAEKQELIRQGKIKKDKHESIIFTRDKIPYEKKDGVERCIADEVPFDIPESWEWCRLTDLSVKEIKRGKSPVYADIGNVLVFSQKCNTKAGFININFAKYLSESVISKYPQEEYMQDEDIIVNSTGTGTLGRIGCYSNSNNFNNMPIVPDSHVTIVRVNKEIIRYIYYVLKYYQPLLEESGEGSTKQKELKPDKIKQLYIPLPPLAEQHRIVEKINELMPVINSISQ